jgi:hypothetical protein
MSFHQAVATLAMHSFVFVYRFVSNRFRFDSSAGPFLVIVDCTFSMFSCLASQITSSCFTSAIPGLFAIDYFRFVEGLSNLVLRHPTAPASSVLRLLLFSLVKISTDFRLITPLSIAIALCFAHVFFVSFIFLYDNTIVRIFFSYRILRRLSAADFSFSCAFVVIPAFVALSIS